MDKRKKFFTEQLFIDPIKESDKKKEICREYDHLHFISLDLNLSQYN